MEKLKKKKTPESNLVNCISNNSIHRRAKAFWEKKVNMYHQSVEIYS